VCHAAPQPRARRRRLGRAAHPARRQRRDEVRRGRVRAARGRSTAARHRSVTLRTGEGRGPVVLPVFKTAWSRVSGTERSTPSLLRQSGRSTPHWCESRDSTTQHPIWSAPVGGGTSRVVYTLTPPECFVKIAEA